MESVSSARYSSVRYSIRPRSASSRGASRLSPQKPAPLPTRIVGMGGERGLGTGYLGLGRAAMVIANPESAYRLHGRQDARGWRAYLPSVRALSRSRAMAYRRRMMT